MLKGCCIAILLFRPLEKGMSLRAFKTFKILVLFLLVMLAQACGQKGSLYLPEESQAALQHTSPLV